MPTSQPAQPTRPMRLGVLVSGGGTTLQAVLDAIDAGRVAAEVVVVVADRDDAQALRRAGSRGIATAVVRLRDHADREGFSAAVAGVLDAHRPDYVLLAGYLKILSAPLYEPYAGRVINTHPALLPAFGGPGMYGEKVHRAVLDYGCKLSGATVHFVDATVDGGPIIAQVAVPVREDDTPDTLAQRVQAEERQAVVQVVGWLAEGRVRVHGRHVQITASGADG